MKVAENAVEISIPRFFKNDYSSEHQRRDALVEGYIKLKMGRNHLFLRERKKIDTAEDHHDHGDFESTLGDNEQCTMYQTLFQPEAMYDDDIHIPAVICIQRYLRGHLTRSEARYRERVFIGISIDKSNKNMNCIQDSLESLYKRRKQEQSENKELYEQALIELKDVVREEEGFEIRESLREDR
eukprot:1750540-Ditylum_brightwellii.AAC.1